MILPSHVRNLVYSLVLFFSPVLSVAQTAELDSVLKTIHFQPDSVRSIFDYVAGETEYDIQSTQMLRPSYQLARSSKTTVLEAIKRKKGVCVHYAELFNALLRRASYESYVVEGYVNPGI